MNLADYGARASVAGSRSTTNFDYFWQGVQPFWRPVLCTAGFVLTLIGCASLAIVSRLSPAWRGYAYAAFSLASNLLLVAAVQAGMYRYAFAVEPLFVAVLIGGMVLVLRLLATPQVRMVTGQSD